MQQRILQVTDGKEQGNSVVYLMSRDQRVNDNHALVAAQQKALELSLPLVVVFHLIAKVQHRAYEHTQFMLQGLEEVAQSLHQHAIPFLLTANESERSLEATLEQLKPAALYTDFSPLHGPRTRIKTLGKKLGVPAFVVDTHNIVPAWVASDKQEFAAHTFRPKIHRALETWLVEPEKVQKHPHQLQTIPSGLSFDEGYAFIEEHYPRRGLMLAYTPGEKAARVQLETFINERLDTYASARNNIAIEGQSELSPYLHFGQISSLRVALEVLYASDTRPLLFDQAKMASAGEHPSARDGMNALFEEMIVRKELSDNFCLYGSSYTNFSAVPQWARDTLAQHTDDPREHTYTFKQLETSDTHDAYWNAAQTELTTKGKMHGYMRMYWAKKLLEWTKTPEEALEYAITLNDRYSIDGGDPNGYVGMLWSIAGLHDRPWTERPIFGKIRYMNAGGLKRKFDVEAYVNRVSNTTNSSSQKST